MGGFGLTAVELMAAHKPVVATNVNGLKQVVEGAGCLFEVGDTKTLAFHINEMLKDEASMSLLRGVVMNVPKSMILARWYYDIKKCIESCLCK